MFRWWCLFAVSACVRSSAVVCEDGSLCPSGTSCHQLDEQPVCVTPEQLAACGTSDEGDSCSTVRSEVGVCRSGFCAALDPCNFADQQVQVPIIDATYIDAGDDLPHASSPTLWVTPQRTTLLRLALGDNSAKPSRSR